ncbi:MAG: efflux RND transporter periplasmic adaptor subunit [Phascolarctobacterium sp.]
MLDKLQCLHKKKYMIPALICVLALGFAAKNVMNKPKAVAVSDTARVQVVKVVSKENTGSLLNTTTSLKAIADVVLKSKVETHLQGLYVRKGERFEAGQLLAELEHRNQSAQVEAMEAQIRVSEAAAAAAKSQKENAAIEQQRYDALIAKGYATRQEVDAKRTTSRTADSDYDKSIANISYSSAQLKAARATLADYLFKAPFAGVVLDDYEMTAGKKVTKETEVLRIADISTIKASMEIPEMQLGIVQPGMQVQVTCDALPNESFVGTLKTINDFVNTNTHTVQADVYIDNAAIGYKLKPGMFARCSILAEGKQQALVIPSDALRSDNTVLVVRENKVEQVPVQLLASKGEEAFLSGGVSEGDLVVVSGGRKLKTGDKVTYKEP